MRLLVHLGVDRLAELHGSFDARAVRKRECELPRLLVPLRSDAHHRPVALVVEQAPARVDEPETAVAANAVRFELDLVRVHEPERFHRRDRDANDASLHVVELSGAARSRRTTRPATNRRLSRRWCEAPSLRRSCGSGTPPAGPAR